ncbi:MAG: hypothetical protein ACI4CA_09645 [Bacteroides sp.]
MLFVCSDCRQELSYLTGCKNTKKYRHDLRYRMLNAQ